MISARSAILLFSISFILFLFALMPISIVLYLSPLEDKAQYSQVSGSLLSMDFTDLTIQDIYIGKVEFSPDFPSIMWGNIGGVLNFSGANRQGEVTFQLGNDGLLNVEKATLVMPAAMRTDFGIVDGVVRVQTDGIVVSLRDGCRSGDFNITTTAFDRLFQQAKMTAPEITGQGICGANGIIEISLVGQSQDVLIKVSGQVVSNQDWSKPSLDLVAVIEPPVGRVFASPIEQLFITSGLSPAGRGYRLLLSTGTLGN